MHCQCLVGVLSHTSGCLSQPTILLFAEVLTSPIRCILAEAGLPSIEDKITETTTKLIPKLFCSPNQLIQNDMRKAVNKITKCKCLCTLRRCAALSKELNIIPPLPARRPTTPPWLLRTSSTNSALRQCAKNSTNGESFCKLFAEEPSKPIYNK